MPAATARSVTSGSVDQTFTGSIRKRAMGKHIIVDPKTMTVAPANETWPEFDRGIWGTDLDNNFVVPKAAHPWVRRLSTAISALAHVDKRTSCVNPATAFGTRSTFRARALDAVVAPERRLTQRKLPVSRWNNMPPA
ncbi:MULTISPECIES: DUF680 domain-containing protein [Mesorhizobium]|uniref:DUF680 domain-containing protein n=1 Tax=Mesorhizobium TaxID=68287 RepID=UPI00101011D8|nr:MULTISPECIES: DUF680 domain-containing protein [Mesorhizobium]